MVVAQGSEAKGPENSVVHVLSQFTGAGAHLRVCLTYIDTIPKFGHRNSPRKAINDIIKFWRSEACSFVELATDHALSVTVLTAIAAPPAGAQTTPQTYCASLPATSCEVLNVELGGVTGAIDSSQSWSAKYAWGGLAIVKYCRNQQLRFYPMMATPYFFGEAAGAAVSSAALGISGSNATMCAALP